MKVNFKKNPLLEEITDLLEKFEGLNLGLPRRQAEMDLERDPADRRAALELKLNSARARVVNLAWAELREFPVRVRFGGPLAGLFDAGDLREAGIEGAKELPDGTVIVPIRELGSLIQYLEAYPDLEVEIEGPERLLDL